MNKITTKRLKTLAKLAAKNNRRWYANVVHFDQDKQRAVVSDSAILLSVPAEVTETKHVSKTDAETLAKISSAQKQETVAVDDVELVPYGKYPPYDAAFPKGEGLHITFDAKNLQRIVSAIADLADKNGTITLVFDKNSPAHRPMLLRDDQGNEALIVSRW